MDIPRLHMALRSIAAAGLALLAACGGTEPSSAEDTASTAVQLRQHQATLPDQPTTLDGGAKSREGVARALLGALADSDTAALRALAVSRAEYAHLVYPESPLVHPPYQQPIEIAWVLHATPHAKGLTRLLQRLAGRSLAYEGMDCDSVPAVQGANRFWTGCRIRFTVDGRPVRARLFTAILERDGRYNVASYDNDF